MDSQRSCAEKINVIERVKKIDIDEVIKRIGFFKNSLKSQI